MKVFKIIAVIILLIGSAVLISMVANEDEESISRDQLPASVLLAFEKAYPEAKEVEFTLEEDDDVFEYEMEFVQNGTQIVVKYSADGQLIESEHVISAEELPTKVSAQLQSDTSYLEIAKVEKVFIGDKTFYEVKVYKDDGSGKKKHEMLFTEDGVLKHSKVEDDDDD